MPHAELEFLTGPRAGERFPLPDGRTVIGRQVGELVLADKEVSSIHAIISYERGGWYIMDLGSTNGVFVSEQVKLEARLREGIEVRVGQTRFRFHQTELDSFDSQSDLPPVATERLPLASELQTMAGVPAADAGGTLIGAEGVPVAGLMDSGAIPMPNLLDEPVPPAYDASDLSIDSEDSAESLGQTVSSEDETPGSPRVEVEVTLETVQGADRGVVRQFRQESVLIGRLNADMVVRDSDVSRRHAVIEVFDASQVYLRDLNSTNGTFVAGRRVASVRLRDGDEIRLGRCVLRFSSQVMS